MEKIFKEITSENGGEWLNVHEMIDETNMIRVQNYVGSRSMVLVDLTNAMKRGLTCERYSINLRYNNFNYCLCNFIYKFGSVKKFFEYLRSLNWNDSRTNDHVEVSIDGINVDIYRRSVKSIRVYSPLRKLEPLKALPKKWTLDLALRAISNKQYSSLKCTGHYTDDYASDAANNYGRGEIVDHNAFVKDILQDPSGWSVWPSNDGSVSVNCHSFDCNSFVPKI